jgi:hypothetical protein
MSRHKHLLNVAHALKFHAHLPFHFWSECVLTAAYLINWTPTPLLENKTHFEQLYSTTPQYSHLRVFGCLCYASILSRNRTKFDHRARACIFVCYPSGLKGYRLYDLSLKQFFISRDVVYHLHAQISMLFPLLSLLLTLLFYLHHPHLVLMSQTHNSPTSLAVT